MRFIITTLFLLVGMIHTFAQMTSAAQLLKELEEKQVSYFDLNSLSDNQLFVRMPYASHEFVNFPGAHVFRGLDIVRVDLVYTMFPKDNDQRQFRLNQNRIIALTRKLKTLEALPLENWGLIAQNACENEAMARSCPHGFVITFSEPHDLPDFTREEKLVEMIEKDSTVITALERNGDWKKMLVVTDLTGSMSPYTAQLLLWFKLAHNTGRVEQLVFFNDGDEKSDSLKAIGQTGGIYSIKPKSFDEIAQLANRVVERGTGGDEPENNVEALLYGLKICPQCEEVIMIADNWASPRDTVLLKQVKKPIRIILCGTDEGVNVDYLNLARETGGSVHTIEEDLYNLLELNEGNEIQIGKEIFVVKNGKFELLKKI